MEKILIIGGEGYIGSVIVDNLLKSNFKITSYDNLIYNNNKGVLNKKKISNYSFVEADILDSKTLSYEIESSFAVILLAGLVGDPITKKYPAESERINDLGVRNVIDICAKNDLSKFIFISTCSNYGLIGDNQLANENFELNPLSLYAKSKVYAEEYIFSLRDRTKMNPTILRFATAFGLSPRMRFDLTINEFVYELAKGNELVIYDSSTWRPYCHVQDFSKLIQLVLEAEENKVSFEIFNAGCDANNSTKKMLANLILERIPQGKITYQKFGNDVRNYRVDFRKVNSVLGFEPSYSIEDGIEELLDAINNRIFDDVISNRNKYGNYSINYPIQN